MSERKHTPGPWTDLPRTECIAICGQDKARLQLGFVNSANPDRVAEGEANARLIAAAPDLLEALESCIEHGSMTGAEWVADKARAAIAKATS
ncbi:hypothetical protein MXL15_25360 [Pseudomonas mosselii]|jgi:hypothetical protein|uniref:hypothetical protein n=1 Tax=Pseudomonas mosselii TaxID=78327 RepID=UPI002DBBB0EA|nr:hypothetical protein [Pseudomonas mosselii]MEB5935519.1 hypothetical protein [Pseudomonas mosselii]